MLCNNKFLFWLKISMTNSKNCCNLSLLHPPPHLIFLFPHPHHLLHNIPVFTNKGCMCCHLQPDLRNWRSPCWFILQENKMIQNCLSTHAPCIWTTENLSSQMKTLRFTGSYHTWLLDWQRHGETTLCLLCTDKCILPPLAMNFFNKSIASLLIWTRGLHSLLKSEPCNKETSLQTNTSKALRKLLWKQAIMVIPWSLNSNDH